MLQRCFQSTVYKEDDIQAEYQRAMRSLLFHRVLQLTEHWHILQSEPTHKHICAEPPLISFRRALSLKVRLVHTVMSFLL